MKCYFVEVFQMNQLWRFQFSEEEHLNTIFMISMTSIARNCKPLREMFKVKSLEIK
jgi:hypothetical protein